MVEAASGHQEKPRQGRSSDHLNMIRGVAALVVFLVHARNIFYVDYPDLDPHAVGPVLKGIYWLTGFGDQSVIVFFVLSGFLIASSILRAHQANRWSWRSYAINRLTRLYVVLLPALLLTIFWDALGSGLFGDHGIYGGHHAGIVVVHSVVERLKVSVFLGNALFLQEILVTPLGSNGPLWSLSYEFWYYVVFPLSVFALFPGRSWKTRVRYAVVACFILLQVGNAIALHFLIWLMGASLCVLPRLSWIKTERGAGFFCWMALMPLSGALIISRNQAYAVMLPKRFLIGAAVFLFIYALLHIRVPGGKDTYAKAARWLAGFSYTLYLVHLPLLVFLQACLVSDHRWLPDAAHLSLGFVVCATVFAYAIIISLLTEAKTEAARHRVTLWSRPRSHPRLTADSP